MKTPNDLNHGIKRIFSFTQLELMRKNMFKILPIFILMVILNFLI